MEVIFSAPDMITLVKAATQVGFFDPVTKQIIYTAPIASGGSWFYNYVGQVSQPTGKTIVDPMGRESPEYAPIANLWGRLRVNGDTTNFDKIIQVCRSFGILIYELKTLTENTEPVWTSDGINQGPDYIKDIAVIA